MTGRPNLATAAQLRSLIESFAESDEDRFYAVAMQIIAKAEKAGNHKVATDLRTLLADAKASREFERPNRRPVPIAAPTGELAGLIAASFPAVRLSDMVLSPTITASLERLIEEQRQSERLQASGLQPRRKLLLVGPPGCGKTMTASAIAGELHLPLMTVQLHSIITKYLGDTALKLYSVFESAVDRPGVYFFDEFDAIGAGRSDSGDVGEMRRVLNAFLTFLEQDQSDSLFVAATNLVSILDPALFRRFDDVITYDVPDDKLREQLIRNRLSTFCSSKTLELSEAVSASDGLSHADVTRACEEAAKQMLLNNLEQRELPSVLTREIINWRDSHARKLAGS
ncbi:putative ATPase [Rhodopirellula baltica SH 1]|uniref:ATPase n=1 Tax=Rhodopirellula baltica (strain DSM 10527 / NCIMB 13988 / SH1) TaxID=243090 RepID=Q7UL35_RHOBA|nr:putative ATPase [Rhodopirellula baltica SH 1]